MLPRYGEWDQTWRQKGLTVVGVHTPEMDYERDEKRLAEFVRKNGIRWPVVLDPEYAAWRRYDIEAWPTAIVIDRAGQVRGSFIGDDQADRIERLIRSLL